MPDRKAVIQNLKVCMNEGQAGNYFYKRFDHLYDRLMQQISDRIVVSGDDFKGQAATFRMDHLQ